MFSIYASNLYSKEAGWKTTGLIGLLAFLAGSADISKDVEKKALNYIHSNNPQEAISLVIDNSKKYKNKLMDMFKVSPKTHPGKHIEEQHSKKPIIKYEPTGERLKTDDKKITELSNDIEKVRVNVKMDTNWFMAVSSPGLSENYKKIEPKLTEQEKNIFYKKFLNLSKEFGQGDPWVKKIMSGSKDWPEIKN
jgi:hypothetical protein